MPVECVELGDRQVVAQSRLDVDGYRVETDAIGLDLLAEISTVTSIVADTAIQLHTELPEVRDLYFAGNCPPLSKSELELVIRSLPALESLDLKLGAGATDHPLDAVGNPARMRKLRLRPGALDSLKELARFESLERLVICPQVAESVVPISDLASLTHLAVWGGSNWAEMLNSTRANLVTLDVEDPLDWGRFASEQFGRLSSLTLVGSEVDSLAVFEGAEALSSLALVGTSAVELPKTISNSLRSLRLKATAKFATSNWLSALQGLESLVIEGERMSGISLTGLAEVGDLSRLRRLEIAVNVGDHDVSALAGLESLRFVRLPRSFSHKRNELAQLLPKAQIVFAGEIETSETVDGISVRKVSESMWSVLEPLRRSQIDGTAIGWESYVKGCIAEANPGALKRLEFDSDTEYLSVSSTSRDDISLVAKFASDFALLDAG